MTEYRPGAQPRSPRLRESVAAATERIQEIVDSAERLAQDIQREAEAEAERHLAERRREADRLAAQASEQLEAALAPLRDHLERIAAEGAKMTADLERAIERLGARTGDGPSDHRRRIGSVSPEAADRAPGELRDAALIRATQMAVSGSGRSEIEAVLREELGVHDPAPLVDQVLER